jgi:hypothetical protein
MMMMIWLTFTYHESWLVCLHQSVAPVVRIGFLLPLQLVQKFLEQVE